MWTEVETTRKNAFGRARTSVAPCNLASGTPEHLLQGCENISGAPNHLLHVATAFRAHPKPRCKAQQHFWPAKSMVCDAKTIK
ncbi:hypothetical protein [Segatella oulorum]|uniref:hypothetical protein n=1 Tax=Segatella oulorum TaxID=28136 RepID=UPI0023F097D4|nr:hypothetical protein [Segatella oulorum]